MVNKVEEGFFINNSYIYPMTIYTNDKILDHINLGEPYMDSDLRLNNALSDNIILPPNCRMVHAIDNGYTFLLEFSPMIRTIGCTKGLIYSERDTFVTEFGGTYEEVENIMATKCLSQTENEYYKIRLQFPWTIFIVTVYGTDGIYSINSMKVYFSKISISDPNDKIFIPPLPNINSDGRLCIPSANKSSNVCDLVSDQVDLFWGSVFNTDLEGHKRAYAKTSNLCNLLKWSSESLKDPLFIFKEQLYRETSLIETGVFGGSRKELTSTLHTRLTHRARNYVSSATTDDGKTYYRGDIITLNDKNYRIDYFLDNGRVTLQEETDKTAHIQEYIKTIHQEYITRNEVVEIEDPVEIGGKILTSGRVIKIKLNGVSRLYVINKLVFDKRIGLYKLDLSDRNRCIVLSDYILKNTVILDKIEVGDTIFVKSTNAAETHIIIGTVTYLDERLKMTLNNKVNIYMDDTKIECIKKYNDSGSLELESPIEETTPFKYRNTVYIPSPSCRYIISNDLLYNISDLRNEESKTKIDISSQFAYRDLETKKTITYSVGTRVVFPETKKKRFSVGEIMGFEPCSTTSYIYILLKALDDTIHRIRFVFKLDDNSLKLNLGISHYITSFKIDFNNIISTGDKVRPKIATIPYMKKSEVLEIQAIVQTKKSLEIYLSNGRCVKLEDLLKYFEIYSRNDAKFNLKKNQLKFKEHPVIPGDIAINEFSLKSFIIKKVYPKRYLFDNGDIGYIDSMMVKPVPTEIPDTSAEINSD